MEISLRLKWAAKYLTLANDGACTLIFLSEWREIPSGPCLAKKKIDGSSRLEVVEIKCVP